MKDTSSVCISCKRTASLKKSLAVDSRGNTARQMDGEEPGTGNAK